MWDPEQIEERLDLQKLMSYYLDSRQQSVLRLRMQGYSYREIGERFGVTGPWVRCIEAKAVRKLKSGVSVTVRRANPARFLTWDYIVGG